MARTNALLIISSVIFVRNYWGLYEGVVMEANDDLMDLLVSIVDHTGEKFICLIDEWDALCREGQEKQIFAIWVIFLTIVRPKVLAFQIMKFAKNLRQP